MEEQESRISSDIQKSKNVSMTKKSFVLMMLVAFITFGMGLLVGGGDLQFGSSRFNNVSIENSANISTEGVQEIYDELVKNYDGQINEEELTEGMRRGLVEAVGDTHTTYLTEEETAEFNSDLNGTFEGIGAELGEKDGFIEIVAPIKGAPAEKAGIKAGDVIIEIDGESSTDISVYEAVKKIRGEKGTEVVLTVVRDGEKKEIPIIRDKIDIPSVEWRTENGIGIIELSRFGTDTTELVEKAAKEFSNSGIEKVILDMRGNPGGLLDEAVTVSNVWLPKGAVVLEEKRGGETVETFTTKNEPVLEGVETVVLIDGGSASASEIVAGALKDNNAATLTGETSYGKGSVQQLIDLSFGGSLKVTIARWFTPGGKNIDKEGINPDTEVKLTPEDAENDNDPQLEEAKKVLSN